MKLGRVVIPTAATVAVVVLGIAAVALVARGVIASEPTSDPDPTPTSAPVVDSGTESTPVLEDTVELTKPPTEDTVDLAETPKEITLELPVFPDKSLSPKVPTAQRSTVSTRTEPPPSLRARPTHGRTATGRSTLSSKKTWSSRKPQKSRQLTSSL